MAFAVVREELKRSWTFPYVGYGGITFLTIDVPEMRTEGNLDSDAGDLNVLSEKVYT